LALEARARSLGRLTEPHETWKARNRKLLGFAADGSGPLSAAHKVTDEPGVGHAPIHAPASKPPVRGKATDSSRGKSPAGGRRQARARGWRRRRSDPPS